MRLSFTSQLLPTAEILIEAWIETGCCHDTLAFETSFTPSHILADSKFLVKPSGELAHLR